MGIQVAASEKPGVEGCLPATIRCGDTCLVQRLKPDANRNTLNVYKQGVSWATDARKPDSYRLAMEPVDGAKSDVRVYCLSKWASTHAKSKIYDVHVTFYASGEHVEKSSTKEIISVDWAKCTCRAGVLGHCKHIAAASWWGTKIWRDPRALLPCAWNKPWATDPDTSRAVASIPHGLGNVDIDAREGQPQAFRSATVESPGGSLRVAIDAMTSTEIEAYDDRALEDKFFTLVLESFDGEPCAAHRFGTLLKIPPPTIQSSGS